MSEDTMYTLQEALTAASQLHQEADQQKNECLAQVAEGLPGKVDALAKKVAHAEPEVTKALGKEGIEKLRTELAHEAALLAADIRGAVNEIKWPMPQSDFDKVDARKIHFVLFEYMYGRRVDQLAAVFKRHGYSVHENNSQRAQGLVLPQSLYEEDRAISSGECITRGH
jgi:hypothetical protein